MTVLNDVPQTKTPLLIRINDKWVNLEAWKRVHPGGEQCIERFRNKDATDAFTSIHSKEAFTMLNKMKAVSIPAEFIDEPENSTTLAFRQWRIQLEKDGWFERTWAWDAFYVLSITILAVIGTLLANYYPLLSILLIGVAMQQAGWIGHDYIHGRGKISFFFWEE